MQKKKRTIIYQRNLCQVSESLGYFAKPAKELAHEINILGNI